MQLSRTSRWSLRSITYLTIAIVYLPLVIILVLSFNDSNALVWPPKGFTTHWWSTLTDVESAREALATSARIGLVAMLIAVVLGTLLSFGLQRFEFFGKNAVSFLAVLPIALPGIVTGVALRNTFIRFGWDLGYLSVVVGHATFCIVVVYNNALARLRRLGTNVEEASMDLGATRFTTFRHVTFPLIRSSLFAGALLAFGLSFDEIIVTTFTAPPNIQTLPIWIFNNLFRPNQAPIVNAVAAALVVVSIVPVYLAQKLSGDSVTGGRA